MTAYLLTHNPSKSAFPEDTKESAWSCGNTKSIKKGDKIFMIRLGAEPKGIFTVGTVTKGSYQDIHWDKSQKNKSVNYIKFNRDKVLTNENIISLEHLKQIDPKFNWTPQKSGISIPPKTTEKLLRFFNVKKYWLFQVMHPDRFNAMVEYGVAAQHYPHGWQSEVQNINALMKINIGDSIIAALKDFKFCGYGNINSGFTRKGNPFPKKLYRYGCREQFSCDWTYLPFDAPVEFKHKDSELKRGLCVKEITEKTFKSIRKQIDDNNPIKINGVNLLVLITKDNESSKAENEHKVKAGGQKERYTNYYERNPKLRKAAIMKHGFSCMACGFDFGEKYGQRGKEYIEVHHKKPISTVKKGTTISVNDLVVLCANCHRMVHRDKDYILSLKELRKIISS